MGRETDIEWCDSTVNPTGFQCCGCELWSKTTKACYAGLMAERMFGVGAFDRPVELKPGVMDNAVKWSDMSGVKRPGKPWLDGRPRVIFLGDMADIFQPAVPFEFIYREVVMAAERSPHVYMMLTKQAKRLAQFQTYLDEKRVPWPYNLWPGVSVTSNRTAWRMEELATIKATHRFVSYEPALEYVDFTPWADRRVMSLLIVGGQSGNDAPAFDPGWASYAIEMCEEREVKCFIKQLGSNCVTPNANLHDWPDETEMVAVGEAFASAKVLFKHSKGGDWNEWPPELRIRQFPHVQMDLLL